MDIFKIFETGFQPRSALVCSGEDDGGDGGGGSEVDPNLVTQINTIVHKIITKRFDSQSFKEAVGRIAGEAAGVAVTDAIAPLREEIAGSKGGDGKGKDGSAPWTESPEYQEMLKRDKARDEEMKRMREERKQEIEQKKRAEEREILTQELRKGGLEESTLRAATALLLSEDKVIMRDDNDQIVWRAQRDGYHDDLPVSAGVAEYLTTDEGKALLPAAGARGTGSKPPQKGEKNAAPPRKLTKEEAAQQFTNWIGGNQP